MSRLYVIAHVHERFDMYNKSILYIVYIIIVIKNGKCISEVLYNILLINIYIYIYIRPIIHRFQ